MSSVFRPSSEVVKEGRVFLTEKNKLEIFLRRQVQLLANFDVAENR